MGTTSHSTTTQTRTIYFCEDHNTSFIESNRDTLQQMLDDYYDGIDINDANSIEKNGIRITTITLDETMTADDMRRLGVTIDEPRPVIECDAEIADEIEALLTGVAIVGRTYGVGIESPNDDAYRLYRLFEQALRDGVTHNGYTLRHAAHYEGYERPRILFGVGGPQMGQWEPIAISDTPHAYLQLRTLGITPPIWVGWRYKESVDRWYNHVTEGHRRRWREAQSAVRAQERTVAALRRQLDEAESALEDARATERLRSDALERGVAEAERYRQAEMERTVCSPNGSYISRRYISE